MNIHKLGSEGKPATAEEINQYPVKEIGIVRDWLKAQPSDSVECPCCGRTKDESHHTNVSG